MGKMLMVERADINAQGGERGNALQAASVEDLDKVVEKRYYRAATRGRQKSKRMVHTANLRVTFSLATDWFDSLLGAL
jgi:hypothetical protein